MPTDLRPEKLTQGVLFDSGQPGSPALMVRECPLGARHPASGIRGDAQSLADEARTGHVCVHYALG